MKAVLLAAGHGTRLGNQEGRPKGLTPVAGTTPIEHQAGIFREFGVPLHPVVRQGTEHWISHVDASSPLLVARNGTSNMVETLKAVPERMSRDGLIVSYGDIIFERCVLSALLESDAHIAVIVDELWERLWRFRMDDPLEDCETLRMDQTGAIVAIGEKPETLSEVEAQYIGLVKLTSSGLDTILDIFSRATAADSSRAVTSMTGLLSEAIRCGVRVDAVRVRGGWLEIDTPEDVDRYLAGDASGELIHLFDPKR